MLSDTCVKFMSLCNCFLTGRVPVPYIALINGITMGGVSEFMFW